MGKNYTDVVIDDKVYTVGCEEDSAYMSELAAYLNKKLAELRAQSGFNKQPYGSRQVLIMMNLADDYLKMKKKAEATEREYLEQETEFYNMKREMVNMRLQMDKLNLQNQVLSMGISGNEEMKEKLMADVVSSVQGKGGQSGQKASAGKPDAVHRSEKKK